MALAWETETLVCYRPRTSHCMAGGFSFMRKG